MHALVWKIDYQRPIKLLLLRYRSNTFLLTNAICCRTSLHCLQHSRPPVWLGAVVLPSNARKSNRCARQLYAAIRNASKTLGKSVTPCTIRAAVPARAGQVFCAVAGSHREWSRHLPHAAAAAIE
jgi:hypothetical protein